MAFIEEAKAHQRLLMFARKAEEEDLPQIAHLFRAVATAEGIHSRRHFGLLESVVDTQSNLERAFHSEEGVNAIYYPKMIREADEDGEQTVVIIFSQSRDVEAVHAKLYKSALNNLVRNTSSARYVAIS
jgi:rubrerythrin